jgi:hypothetical protein
VATITPPGTSGVGWINFNQAAQFSARNPATNPATTIQPAKLRKYYAGESVSSVIPGNPGPQPNFDINSPTYKQVVRDLYRLSP